MKYKDIQNKLKCCYMREEGVISVPATEQSAPLLFLGQNISLSFYSKDYIYF